MKNDSAAKLRLHCYAPGNGCLCFSWMDDKGIAQGREVTKDDAVRFLRRESSLHLRRYGFRVYRVDSAWVLAREVVIFNDLLHFEVDPDDDAERPEPSNYLFKISDHERRPYVDSQLTLKFRHMTPHLVLPRVDNQVSIDSEWFEVKNQSIRLAVLYYLNHKDQIDLQEGYV